MRAFPACEEERNKKAQQEMPAKKPQGLLESLGKIYTGKAAGRRENGQRLAIIHCQRKGKMGTKGGVCSETYGPVFNVLHGRISFVIYFGFLKCIYFSFLSVASFFWSKLVPLLRPRGGRIGETGLVR